MPKNKEKKYNKLIIFISLTILIIALNVIFYSKFIYNENSYYTENHLQYNNSYKIEGKVVIEQNFIANGKNLEAVAIRI